MRFLDLFAGAGGLSEGFIQAGFEPVAHVESDANACLTLQTRGAFHFLEKQRKTNIYYDYVNGRILRTELFDKVPEEIRHQVLNHKIGTDNAEIFRKIDLLRNGSSIDIVIGGPRCQAYSVVGMPALKKKLNDPRKTLYIEYIEFLKKYQPRFFVFENVPGLLSKANADYYSDLKLRIKDIGYDFEAKTLNALHFNVAQNRRRVLIVGWRKDIGFTFPEIIGTEFNGTSREIFNDLPPVLPGVEDNGLAYTNGISDYLQTTKIRTSDDVLTQHYTRAVNNQDRKIYELAIHELKKGVRLKNSAIPDSIRTQKNVSDFLDRFKVVGEIPHTVLAHLSKDGHHYIHPDIEQCRSITIREAARMQSFPDNYFFEGSRTSAFKQIGNAVPPLLAFEVAKILE